MTRCTAGERRPGPAAARRPNEGVARWGRPKRTVPARPLRTGGGRWTAPVALGLLAGCIVAAMALLRIESMTGAVTRPDTYVRTFGGVSRPIDVALATGDGQAFAAMAMDPTMARPDVYPTGRREAAYRAQRPFAGYAAWLLSAGRPRLVAPALAVLFVVGQALATATAAVLLRRRGGRPELALLLVVVPPSLAALQWLGPEPIGLAFVLAGAIWWERGTDKAAVVAAVLFSLAGLTRETNLLVPMALGLAGFVLRRRPLRQLVPLALPGAAWLAWSGVVHARLGVWPWSGGSCRLSGPVSGLLAGVDEWPAAPVAEVASLASFVLIAVGCAVWRPRDEFTWVVVACALATLFLGPCVWESWQHFTRTLLPLYGLGMVVLATRRRPSTPLAGVATPVAAAAGS